MGEQPPPKLSAPLPPEDDPQSELNVLRREVRQLQAAVRDAALQIAAHQETAIALRRSLAAAEADLDDALAREAALRARLDLQRVKKDRVESTLAAAEALVSALRDMVVEADARPAPPAPAPAAPSTLDALLSRIAECPAPAPAPHPAAYPVRAAAEPATASTTDPERHPAALSVEPASPPPADDAVGRTELSPRAPAPVPDRPEARLAPRRELPRVVSPRLAPAPAPRPPSNLLLSAFGPPHGPAPHQPPVIRSAAMPPADALPSDVADVPTLPCPDDPPRRVASPLPSRVRAAIPDAHSGDIYAITSSPDGKWLASGGDDKLIKIYDSCGAPYASISELSRSVTALTFGPEVSLQGADFGVIYCATSDGSVRSFRKSPRRRAKWTLGSVYPVHTSAVRKLLFTDAHGVSDSSPPHLILSCSTDRAIKLSDVESGRRPYAVTTPSAVLDVASFGSAGSGTVVSGHKDGGVRLWSVRDQSSSVASAKVHVKGVVSVACLDDGHTVVSLGRDNMFKVCDIRTGLSIVQEIDGGVETVSDWHRMETYDRHIACGMGRNGQLGIWNVDTGKLVRSLSSQASDSNADVLDMVARKLRNPGCVVAPHWTTLGQFACAHRSRQVSFWDTA